MGIPLGQRTEEQKKGDLGGIPFGYKPS